VPKSAKEISRAYRFAIDLSEVRRRGSHNVSAPHCPKGRGGFHDAGTAQCTMAPKRSWQERLAPRQSCSLGAFAPTKPLRSPRIAALILLETS
jgi:hypothetical protein